MNEDGSLRKTPLALQSKDGEARWWLGALAVIKATAKDTGGQLAVVEVTEPPGAEAPLHVHHREDEAFWILDGDVTFEVGETKFEATKGDFAFGPRDIPHRYEVGGAGCRLLFMLTPGGFEELIMKMSEPAPSRTLPPPPESEPDMEQIQGLGKAYGIEMLGQAMSRENVDLVRRGDEAFRDSGEEAVFEYLHADIDMTPVLELLVAEAYQGHAGFRHAAGLRGQAVSEENVELVRATFDETRRHGDPTPRAEHFDPEFEFHEDPRLPEARLYRGVEEVLAYWRQFIENFDEFVIEPEDFVDIGGSRVLVPLMITTRGRGSSAGVTMPIAWIFTVRDRLITRIEAFADREDALETAGLRE